MSASDLSPASPVSKLLPHAWWIVLIVALAVHWFATERRVGRAIALTDFPTWSVSPPEIDASSATGYAGGQRSLIVPGHHSPSFHWITEAQLSVEQGRLRLRSIDYDAYPNGREITRTSPYRWWLISVGWIRSAMTGESMGLAIEMGTLYSDPLLYSLMLLVGAVYCARCIGCFSSIGFVLGALCIFPLSANFQSGAPDPHSLSWILALGSLLPLFAVSDRKCIHFMVAGVFGAIGFWNDAQSQAPLLLAIALGGIAHELCSKEESCLPWRSWSFAGAPLVIIASLFEFAPNHLSASLDMVSPLYALIWLGFAEVLRVVSLWRRNGLKGFSVGQVSLFAAAVLAVFTWPALAILGDTGSLLASDFYARELANHANGGLASNLGVWLGRASGGTVLAVLLPCGLIAVLLYRLLTGSVRSEYRGRFVFLLVSGLLILVLGFFQLRWFNLLDVWVLVLLPVLIEVPLRIGLVSMLRQLAPVVSVLPGILVGFPSAAKEIDPSELSSMEKQALLGRDFGYWLNKYGDSENTVLFSTPLFSGTSAYYGGYKSTVSSDGSNKLGLESAARLAASDSLQEISILAESLQVTHVVIPLWDPMVERLVQLGLGESAQSAEHPNAFLLSLRDWDLPPFVRALNYPGPTDRAFQAFTLTTFVLQEEQAGDLALSRLADLFVERGQWKEARMIREVLESYPRSLYALSSIANIDTALRDADKVEESLDALIPYLSRRAARNIPLDRRVNLAILLLKNKRVDLAKEQLALALLAVELESLNTMTPDAVAGLMAMSRSLMVPFLSDELESAALEFVPVGLRQQLERK